MRRRHLRKQASGFVYVAHDPDDERQFMKVGFAQDPKARMRTLNTSRTSNLEIYETFPASEQDEERLHELLAPFRHKREWFLPKIEDVIVDLSDTRLVVCSNKGLGDLTGEEGFDAMMSVPLGELIDTYADLLRLHGVSITQAAHNGGLLYARH